MENMQKHEKPMKNCFPTGTSISMGPYHILLFIYFYFDVSRFQIHITSMGKQENAYVEGLLADFLGINNFLHPNLHGIYMDIFFIISP